MTIRKIDSVLGKKVEYKKQYDPSILVREARSRNRLKYDLHDKSLPFMGYDIWHCYEVNFLTNNNCPINRIGKLKYSCSSKYIVESKSLKLYLNSFNMTQCGKTSMDAEIHIEKTIIRDLSELIQCSVEFRLFDDWNTLRPYENYPFFAPGKSLEFSKFKESPELLSFYPGGSFIFSSDLLRSNCKVTKQQDVGDIFIYMEKVQVELSSLFQYIVSFRNENHFHEEVVEMIYKRLWSLGNPAKLMVGAIYTRRGGIDICPCRASHEELLDECLIDTNLLTNKLARQ